MYSDKEADSVQTIEAPSLEDCKRILYRKYGAGGYKIDSHKTTLSPGFLGFGQKERVTVSYHLVQEKSPVSAPPKTQQVPQEKPGEADAVAGETRDEFLKNIGTSLTNAQLKQIVSKLDALSRDMEKVNKSVSEGVVAVQSEHPTIGRIEEILRANEFTEPYIAGLTEKIRAKFSLDELSDFEAVQSAVLDWIGEGIRIADDPAYRPPHVIVIVGPTGVGKTTTLAKLAAGVLLAARGQESAPSVRLITTDYVRVGALEMLERYGGIMNVSVDKAESAEDVKTLYNRYRTKTDYIFIDTSGLSPKDYKNIAGMRAILDVPAMHADVYLAVTASTKASDLETILRNYEQFAFRSVIITKYDETTTYGNVLSVLSLKGKPVSWITTGQEVPSYIERANPGQFLMDLDGFHKDEDHIRRKFKYEPPKADK